MKIAYSVIVAFAMLALRGAFAAHEGGAFEEADRALKGEVSVVGIPHEFPDGRIDWLFNPTSKKGPFNPEWTWQLNRMYFWTALAEAYSATGDEKYARAFVRQFSDWFAQTGGVPPEKDFNSVGSPWRTIEEGLRLLRSWDDAWHAFSKSPSFCGKVREDFVKSAHAQARHLLAHSTNYNWLLIEMSGAYVFALNFPDFPDSEYIRREALSRFYAAASKQLCPDGQHNEVSLDYHLVFYSTAASICLRAMEAGKGGELPKGFLELLERGAEGPLAQMTPNFSFPCFNDSNSFRASRIFGTAAKLFPARADFLWAATEGKEGAPPAGQTASRFLPYSGIAVMRSGWNRDATYLAFDVGPTGANHIHQDKLSFAFWKGGEELVFDDGGGQYEWSDLRSYATSGYGHSTLLVDGLAQNRSSPRVSERPIDAGWRSDEKEDFAFGVYDQGFGPKELRLARHRREIRFDKAADEFFVADIVESADGKEHNYTLLFQIDSTNVVLSADGRTLSADFGRDRKWALSMTLPEGAKSEIVSGRLKPTPAGWYFGRIGTSPNVHPATTLFVKFPPMKSLKSLTRLRATPSDRPLPQPEPPTEVVVAAANSRSFEKRVADFVCTGTNDEVTINAAIACLKFGGTVRLADGDYFLDSCTNEGNSAIIFGYNDGITRVVTLKGTTEGKVYGDYRGATLHVTKRAMDAMAEDGVYRVFFGAGRIPEGRGDTYTYTHVNNVNFVNFRVLFHDASKPLVGIDGRHFGSMELDLVGIYTERYFPDRYEHMKPATPAKGSIGVYSLPGSNDESARSRYNEVNVGGLHTGFVFNEVDHLVMTGCMAARCVYGYWFERGSPKTLTMINCCDEGNAHLPRFRGRGHLTAIDFNAERFNAAYIPDDPDGDGERGAVEEQPGGWSGYISYTLQGTAYGLGTGNWKPARFWRDGDGKNFKTVDHNAR